jgi:hypothetical protein
LSLVPEGTQAAEQARFRVRHGRRRLQGNDIGLPMSSADFLACLESIHRTEPVT